MTEGHLTPQATHNPNIRSQMEGATDMAAANTNEWIESVCQAGPSTYR